MLQMLKIWLEFNKIYCFTVTIIASELCSNLIRFAIILILPRAGRPPAAGHIIELWILQKFIAYPSPHSTPSSVIPVFINNKPARITAYHHVIKHKKGICDH